MIEINDIDDDRISHYRSLRFTPKLHSDTNSFIAEGEKIVLKLLQSDIQILSIFALEEILTQHQALIEKRKIPSGNVMYANKDLMLKIVGFNVHSGIMAMGRQTPDTALTQLKPPVIIMNGIVNTENVGSIVRNAAAFGFSSVIADESSASPWLRRSVRVSMGNIFNMQVHHSDLISNTIEELRSIGFLIIAAEITGKSQSLYDLNIRDEKYCIIFGSEGQGISKEILDLSDSVIHIPIAADVPSLNVASSSAVILSRLSKIR